MSFPPFIHWSYADSSVTGSFADFPANQSRQSQLNGFGPARPIPGLWPPPYSQYDMSVSLESNSNKNFLLWRRLHLNRAKLKASSRTSALLSGFAMVAMVEVQICEDSKLPEGLLIAFAICTTLLVAVHLLALMISTCILPNVEAVSNLHSWQVVNESPHEKMQWYIDIAWLFSTILGILLFLLEIVILSWVKFYEISKWSAWASTILLVPILIIFIGFAFNFYNKLIAHKYELSENGIRQLELLRCQLDADPNEIGNGITNLAGANAV